MKLARLSRLHLTEDEIDQFTKEIAAILTYVEQLQKLDLKNVKPTNQVTGLTNVMRKDEEIKDGAYKATHKDLLKNAPATQGGHIKVKRVLT